MTKIVGHRGAKGLELENTIKGFKLAKSLGVDAIEFDVLSTRDGKIVVCHDNNLKRLSGRNINIDQVDFSELAEVHLQNGETVPLLYDVLALVKGTPVIIDIKTTKHLDELFRILMRYPDLSFTIVTWHRQIIPYCKQMRPDIQAFVERFFAPGLLIRSVLKHGADGLNLRYLWLNPITYYSARKRGFNIQVYTINSRMLARIIQKLYPEVWICTNHPDIMLETL